MNWIKKRKQRLFMKNLKLLASALDCQVAFVYTDEDIFIHVTFNDRWDMRYFPIIKMDEKDVNIVNNTVILRFDAFKRIKEQPDLIVNL